MANSKYRRRSKSIAFESLESRRVLATLAGTVYEDVGNNGVLDDSDPRIGGAVVYLDTNDNGVLDQRGFGMDPDEFETGQVLNRARQTIFPSGTGEDNQPAFRIVVAEDAGRATTGQHVFGLEGGSDWTKGQKLRFDFTLPVDSVSLDVIGSSSQRNANVQMDAFDEMGELIQSDRINGVANSEARILQVTRTNKDISYVVAYVDSTLGSAKFDNLRADDAGSERATITSDSGFYRFSDVPNGNVIVAQQVPEGYDQSTPDSTHKLDLSGGFIGLNFGNRTASIGGFLFDDQGEIGTYEPSIDQGIAGAGVYLDTNLNGRPDPNPVDIFPGVFLENQVLDFVSEFVELSAASSNNAAVGTNVVAAVDPVASPDGNVFTHEGNAAWDSDNRFRADFAAPAISVQLRFTGGTDTGLERGRMVAYSASGVELASVLTRDIAKGETQTLSIQRPGFDISYIVAYTAVTAEGETGSGRLSDLRTSIVREPVAISNASGEYEFKPLSSGDYAVRALPARSLVQSFPESPALQVGVEVGDSEEEINFGFEINNDSPIARADAVTTLEEDPVSIRVLINDVDPDGQLNEGSVMITVQPINGTAEVTVDGIINYTPNANFNGRDSLQYTVLDDQGAISNTAIATIDVTPENDAPIAVNDRATRLGLGPAQIAVLRNDTDVDGDIDLSTLTIVTQPSTGSVEIDAATGIVTYTSDSNVSDSFTYTVEDNAGAISNEATVTITSLTAGVAPVAVDDVSSTLEGTARQLDVAGNDTDADGTIDLTSVFIVMNPTSGSVEVSAAGRVTYQPSLGFIGVDTFSYRVRDNTGLESNTAQVSFTMTERDFPYQNPIDVNDIDGNGIVIPRDVLFILTELNNKTISDETGRIVVDVAAGDRPAAYYDTDANGFVTPRDVLSVIQAVNAQSAVGEPDDIDTSNALAAAAVANVFADPFDAMDDDEDEA